MGIQSVPIDTPTIASLKAQGRALKVPQGYGFYLTDAELSRLAKANLPMSAVVAFALIRSASRAAPKEKWVTLRARAREALGRDWRWWHDQTSKLEAAGFISCERHRGRLPRFHVIKARYTHNQAGWRD
jgi:hypothetical protein